MDLDPIVHEYRLTVTPARAFDVYTAHIGAWWPPEYSANAATLETVVFEPWVGGSLSAHHRVEGGFRWGTVTIWEPGRRLSHTWTLAQTEEHPSEVTLLFAPADGGTRLHFEHGGWHAGNADARQTFREWPRILARFVARAEAR